MIVNFSKDLSFTPLVAGSLTTGTKTYTDTQGKLKMLWLLHVLTNDNVLDMKLVQATSAAGADVKDIEGAVITQLASGADKIVMIELDWQQLDTTNGFQFVAPVLTVAGTATGSLLQISDPNRKPATQPAEVIETVLLAG